MSATSDTTPAAAPEKTGQHDHHAPAVKAVKAVKATPKPKDEESKTETAAKALVAAVQEDAVKPETPTPAPAAEAPKAISKIDFGDAGTLQVEPFGHQHYGAAGSEQSVVVRISDTESFVLQAIPAKYLS